MTPRSAVRLQHGHASSAAFSFYGVRTSLAVSPSCIFLLHEEQVPPSSVIAPHKRTACRPDQTGNQRSPIDGRSPDTTLFGGSILSNYPWVPRTRLPHMVSGRLRLEHPAEVPPCGCTYSQSHSPMPEYRGPRARDHGDPFEQDGHMRGAIPARREVHSTGRRIRSPNRMHVGSSFQMSCARPVCSPLETSQQENVIVIHRGCQSGASEVPAKGQRQVAQLRWITHFVGVKIEN